jgi:hypothetical protein
MQTVVEQPTAAAAIDSSSIARWQLGDAPELQAALAVDFLRARSPCVAYRSPLSADSAPWSCPARGGPGAQSRDAAAGSEPTGRTWHSSRAIDVLPTLLAPMRMHLAFTTAAQAYTHASLDTRGSIRPGPAENCRSYWGPVGGRTGRTGGQLLDDGRRDGLHGQSRYGRAAFAC